MNKLPVIDTFKSSVGYTLSNISLLFRAAAIWVALYFVANFVLGMTEGGTELLNLLVSSQNPASDANLEMFDQFSNIPASAWAIYIVAIIISFLGYYSIAISWHRACLLDEIPPFFRLSALEFRYFGYSLVVGLIIMGIVIVGSLVLGFVGAIIGGMVMAVLGGVLLIGVLMLSLRFTLVYPGVSVKDRRMSLAQSYNTTNGNSWQLLGGTLLCILPSIVVAIILAVIAQLAIPFYISATIMFAGNLISGAFILSFMSMCYQFFVPSPEAGDLG